MNDYSVYLLDALEIVSAWDLPDDDIADAVNAQARLMAGQYDCFEDKQMTSDSH